MPGPKSSASPRCPDLTLRARTGQTSGPDRRAFWRAMLGGAVMQAVLIPIELVLPLIREHNLGPFLRTVPAILSGFLFARWSGRHLAGALLGGGLVGGASGFLASLLAGLLGAAHPSPVALVVNLTGGSILPGVGGALFAAAARHER